MQTVTISVRQLVEFILRAGDIDSAYMSANRALEGTRVHQHVQKKRKAEAAAEGAAYEREVTVDFSCEFKGIIFALKGRADGVRKNADGAIIIEEIKSTVASVSTVVDSPEHWHWAQAKCYGYMFMAGMAEDERLASITAALTYGQIETFETRTFTREFSFDELSEFFFALLEKYWAFAKMDLDRLSERERTAKALAFPFGAYRLGQRELAVAVFTAIRQKKKLFAQAPTGIGKTISTLFPAVKALAEGSGTKCFYLTAKTVARQVAVEAMRKMKDAGLVMRSIQITAKDKICPLETRRCEPDYCPYANGHFDRINGAILELLNNEQIITRETVEAFAKKHSVCPAELQLDASLFCDVIICDYNHAYDPKAKLQRFFSNGGDYILLNDEAHNLFDRARDMFSAGLYKNDFDKLRKALGKGHKLYKPLSVAAKEIRKCWMDKVPFHSEQHPVDLLNGLFKFAEACDEYLQAHHESEPLSDEILTVYFSVLDYIRVAEIFDEHFVFFCEPQNGYVALNCLDPSYQLSLAQKKVRACVFFSATLTPLYYFRKILGGAPEDFTLRMGSPFPRENLCLLMDDSVSTRYKDRAASYGKIAARLHAMVSAKNGNYIAFFPSYAYLDEVYTQFADAFPQIKVMIQRTEMPDGEREVFLEAFADAPEETMLAFAVIGGAFSEGIDLKGERLIGAAVIGVGLPQICEERNILMEYFNRTGNSRDGFDFAYRYPGMNKVLQAAGRVIRTETDRGVVYLIDDRFNESAYKELFPPEWNGCGKVRSEKQLAEVLGRFWGVKRVTMNGR